jgi:E3 ubiquitin-protein ligase HERC2
LLLDNGELYSWGLGLYGSLGHGDTDTVCSPQLIEALAGMSIIKAVCGVWHTLALTGNKMSKSYISYIVVFVVDI